MSHDFSVVWTNKKDFWLRIWIQKNRLYRFKIRNYQRHEPVKILLVLPVARPRFPVLPLLTICFAVTHQITMTSSILTVLNRVWVKRRTCCARSLLIKIKNKNLVISKNFAKKMKNWEMTKQQTEQIIWKWKRELLF